MHSAKGGYRVLDAKAPRKVVLVATGSEVEIAVKVAAALELEDIGADVVSMPCTELFDAQDDAYRANILPDNILTVSIEAGVTLGWERYIGRNGLAIGIDSFGASGPIDELYNHFGFSPDDIVTKIKAKLDA